MSIYATPKIITRIEDCYFYHTMDLPGYGIVEGECDLRQNVKDYLGGLDFNGKRVLEVGAANGFLSFYMEKQGAEVIAYDLSENESWDLIPYSHSQYDYQGAVRQRKLHISKINNAFWLAHKAYRSRVKMVHGDIYHIPQGLGGVDISIFGSILLHVRDPFLALQNALKLTRQTVVITDLFPQEDRLEKILWKLWRRPEKPLMYFLPDFNTCEPYETWWRLTPEVVKKFIGVLGFTRAELKCHFQIYRGGHKQKFFTIVGHRNFK